MRYFYECGICDHLHPCQFMGDCRDDSNRFTDEDVETRFAAEGYEIVPMNEADDWPAIGDGTEGQDRESYLDNP